MELTDITIDEMRCFTDVIDDDVYAVLSVEGSMNSRVSVGGTARARVEEALICAEQELGISK